jgi:hypothetical protein
MSKKLGEVRIPATLLPHPEKYEISAAAILASYFKTDVHFVVPTAHKTADFLINNTFWELKSPTGSGKRNIQRTLQDALKQSENIIFDARRSKIHQNKITSELKFQFRETQKMKRLILISKAGIAIEMDK